MKQNRRIALPFLFDRRDGLNSWRWLLTVSDELTIKAVGAENLDLEIVPTKAG